MSVTCRCGSVRENHGPDGDGCTMCSCPQWRECYHDDSRMECLTCTRSEAMEEGFHQGKQFAVDIITKAILANEDTPIIALDAARKVLSAFRNEKTPSDGSGDSGNPRAIAEAGDCASMIKPA